MDLLLRENYFKYPKNIEILNYYYFLTKVYVRENS